MIFIITHQSDYTADFLINRLNKRKVAYFRFNTDNPPFDLLDLSNINCQFSDSNFINSIRSVWYRRRSTPIFDAKNKENNLFLSKEYQYYLSNIFALINNNAKWMSLPEFIEKAENKLLQLDIARKLGFKTPKTLVSTSRSKIVNFIKEFENGAIIKPLRENQFINSEISYKIFTNVVNSKDIELLEEETLFPSIYQEKIEKECELRVTVVDNQYFVGKVDSQNDLETKTDWRKKRLIFTEHSIDSNIGNKCVKLAKAFNLSFSAIDMVVDKKGDYYFLENNPNGQWAWIEFDTGLPISDSIIKYLLDYEPK